MVWFGYVRTVAAQPLKIKIKIRQLTKDRIFLTYPSEMNQVLELSPVYKILTINTTLDEKTGT